MRKDYRRIARTLELKAREQGSREFGTVANAVRLKNRFEKRDLSRWEDKTCQRDS